MATMFPESASVFTTEGEKVFYNFLSKVARPDSQVLAWYEPDISGREPDFILFSPDCGLIVFEVKDWRVEQILEANPKEFRLHCGAHNEPRKNPQAQAREYVKELLTRITRDQSEAKQSPGKSPVPITEGIVLPYITKSDFLEAKLDQVIPVRIPDKLTSDSTGNRPPVPAETDQEIGAKRRWFWDAMGTGQLGSMMDFIFRMDSPLRLS